MSRIPWEDVRYFKSSEFDSSDAPGTGELMRPKVVFALEALRSLVGKPFRINSGYRTAAHNKAVGGAPHSAHTEGLAADVSTTGWTKEQRRDFIIYARKLGFNGVGVAKTYIHIDMRDRIAAWIYRGSGQVAIPVGQEAAYL